MKKLLKIRYDGTDFCGYQVQPDRRTVQGELNRALFTLIGCDCNVTGCSRTDSGVHACSFFAAVDRTDKREISIPSEKLPRALNSVLPDDISVLAAYDVSDGFHPRYDVIAKEYTYFLNNSGDSSPFLRNRAFTLIKPLTQEQINRVNEACGYLLGEHDFAAFMAEGSSVKSTVREIYYARLETSRDIYGEDLLAFKISGNGFLYNMVRIIVGSMLDVAYSRIRPQDIAEIINSADRSKAGRTVPPHGLYLTSVTYPDEKIK